MKQTLKKLWPVLLLFGAAFMLVNCQDDYEDRHSAPQQNGSVHKILTGSEAQRMRAPLINDLRSDDGKGLIELSRSLSRPTHRLSNEEIYRLIDSTIVYEVKFPNGDANYTYRVNHPDANDTIFYNVVNKVRSGFSKTILIEYAMDPGFAATYARTGDLSGFTGVVRVNRLRYHQNVPCPEEPNIPIPVTSGKGAQAGGSNQHPIYDPNYGYTYNQHLVNWQYLSFQFSGSTTNSSTVTSGSGNGQVEPEPAYFNVFMPEMNNQRTGESGGGDDEPGGSEETPCGNEDEIGILDPEQKKHEEDCEKLKALSDHPNVKSSLNFIKGELDSHRERLFSFNSLSTGNIQAVPEKNNSGSTATMARTNRTFGVAHIHQEGPQNSYSGLMPMFAIEDIGAVYLFAKEYEAPVGPNGPMSASFFFNILVVDEYTYAVFPNNPQEFAALTDIFENDRKRWRLDKDLQALYAVKMNEDGIYNGDGTYEPIHQMMLAEIFLNFINDPTKNRFNASLNMSLYRISNTNNHNGTWEKLELGSDKKLKDPIPCK